MTLLHIPKTSRDAVKQLNEKGGLIFAREWERAAIVFAFTRDDGRGSWAVASSSHSLTFRELADMGVVGLRSKDTVARYHRAWAATGRPSAPGTKVDTNGLGEFPPDQVTVARGVKEPDRRAAIIAQAEADGVGPSKALDIASNPKAMAAAIKADAKVASYAMAALDQRRRDSESDRVLPLHKPDTERDAHRDALKLISTLRKVHKHFVDVVALAQNVRGKGAKDLREAVHLEVEWIRAACDVIETGVNGGSLDDQLRDLLDAEAGR